MAQLRTQTAFTLILIPPYSAIIALPRTKTTFTLI
jgi:hypothetical protein